MDNMIKDDRSQNINSLIPVFITLFTLSGAAGLIYEVVWVRELTFVLGASTHAVTIILAAFMAGLGLGSWFLGKFADRFDGRKLAKWYILLEIGIGIYAASLPLILEFNKQIYIAFNQNYVSGYNVSNSIRLLLAFITFIFPTALMGSTLPIMSRYIIRSKNIISVTVSRLYAFNTFGAVLGTVAAGYFLLPNFGNNITTALAVGIDFSVAVIFFFVHRKVYRNKKQNLYIPVITSENKKEKLTALQKSVMWAFAISGVAAMIYEVAWTRALSMILGTTTYAFTTMLATFLLGISIGSILYKKMQKFTSAINQFIILELIIAFSAILTIPFLGKLPFLYLMIHNKFMDSWVSVQFARFFLAALVMIIPTIALGCILPVVSDLLVKKTDILGKRLGKAYGFNTFGGVMGACIAGLFLIPFVGIQKAIIAGAFINLIAAIIVCLSYTASSFKYRAGVALGSLVALILFTGFLKPWSPKVMSSGVYVYASRYSDLTDRVESGGSKYDDLKKTSPWELWEMAMKQYSLLYYNTGQTATVSVMERNDGVRFLTVDGKTDASSNYSHDMKTQVLLGQLPLLYQNDPDRVFIVGLGSGVTVGSILTHDVRAVDCVEYSTSVIEAAEYFSKVNHNALEDKRLKIIPRDARNVLMTNDKNYDVIISQPSNPWISGQSSLFSVEWYKTVKKRLIHGGVFAQWIPAYHMAKRDIKIIVHTLRSVFPHVTAWTSGSQGELILIAEKGGKLKVPYHHFIEKVKKPEIRNDIERLGYNVETLPLWTFAMNEDDLSVYLYSDLQKPIRKNTDDLLFTEFSTPKQMVDQNVVSRFKKQDKLHGDIESLMKILDQINLEQVMKLLNSG